MEDDIHKNMVHILSEFDDSGTTDFVKWIVGLSIGLIIFSASRIGENAPWGWKIFVGLIFILLMLAIISGIEFVSTVLDTSKTRCALENAKFKHEHFSKLDKNKKHNYNGEDLLVDNILGICLGEIEVLQKNIKGINNRLVGRYHFQKYMFVIGIVLVLILGIFYWK